VAAPDLPAVRAPGGFGRRILTDVDRVKVVV
jgi:hypothetical protein